MLMGNPTLPGWKVSRVESGQETFLHVMNQELGQANGQSVNRSAHSGLH